jgi:hypothetical protein
LIENIKWNYVVHIDVFMHREPLRSLKLNLVVSAVLLNVVGVHTNVGPGIYAIAWCQYNMSIMISTDAPDWVSFEKNLCAPKSLSVVILSKFHIDTRIILPSYEGI